MANAYILRAELTDAMNRLRDSQKRCRALEEQVTKMELEIIKLRDQLHGKEAVQTKPGRTADDQGSV